MNELSIIKHKDQLAIDSRDVAKAVGKNHKELLRSIDRYADILTSANLRSLDFFVKEKYVGVLLSANLRSVDFFIPTSYKDPSGKKNKAYYLTKKGCDMVANKMTGEKGILFTAAYINRFYEMESKLKSQDSARLEHPEFTNAIKEIHENPAPYHFSNESDLINRIVLGMSAKQYKEVHGIPASEKSIRPYLSSQDIYLIDRLQKADIGIMLTERDYGKRKMLLEWYKNKLLQSQKQITA